MIKIVCSIYDSDPSWHNLRTGSELFCRGTEDYPYCAYHFATTTSPGEYRYFTVTVLAVTFYKETPIDVPIGHLEHAISLLEAVLKPGVWIRIQIGSVFRTFVRIPNRDPDPDR